MGVLLEESRQDVYNVGILGTLCTLDAGRLGPNQDLGSEGDPAGYSLKENREPGTKKKRLLKGPQLSAFHLEPSNRPRRFLDPAAAPRVAGGAGFRAAAEESERE